VLDEQGRPTPVEFTVIVPPLSQLGPITAEQRASLMQQSPVRGKYDQRVDRESAFEKLSAAKPAAPVPGEPTKVSNAEPSALQEMLFGRTGPRGGRHDGLVQTAAQSAARTVANQIGRELLRGLLGGLSGGRRR
jgi:hypothetical protein